MDRKLNNREIFVAVLITFMACSLLITMITMIVAIDTNVQLKKSIEKFNYVFVDTSTTQEYEINGKMQEINDYSKIENAFLSDLSEKGYDDIKVFDTDDVNETVMDMYFDKYIVERTIGVVTNEKNIGDGKILNTSNEFDYISYRNSGLHITDGTVVLTYFVYSPSSYDPIERYDFILDRENED